MSFRFLRPMLSVLALLAASCSSSSSDDDGGGCSITLTGAVVATEACTTPAVAVNAPADHRTTVGFSAVDESDTAHDDVFVSIGFDGPAATGTYTTNTSNTASGVLVRIGGISAWVAVAGGGMGDFSLTITSLSYTRTDQYGTSYNVHGTLTATLVSGVGAAGTVAVKARF
jgi:hypothetical protein